MTDKNIAPEREDYRTQQIDAPTANEVPYHGGADSGARDGNTGYDATIGGGIGLVGGAVVGGLAGGPVGAVIGAVIGGVAGDVAVGAIDRIDHDGSPGDTRAEGATAWDETTDESRPDQEPSIMSSAYVPNNQIGIAPVGPGYGPGPIGFTGGFDAILDSRTGDDALLDDARRRNDEIERDIAETQNVTNRLDAPDDRE